MARTLEQDPKILTGYRLEQLASAFDRVRDPRDWKAPIRAVILASDRSLVEKAVLWFTNTVPTFTAAESGRDRLVVRAVGYRGGPVGDARGEIRIVEGAVPGTIASSPPEHPDHLHRRTEPCAPRPSPVSC